MSDLSWLNPTPHTIAVYASSPLSPAATQHSLPSGRYPLLGPDFHRLDRTSLRLAHVAVGTRVSSRPPHRTVRAAFPHTACMGVSLSRVHHAIFVVLCCFILLFDPCREHSSIPTAHCRRRRAQRRSRTALLQRRRRLVLDGREHDGRLPVIGYLAHQTQSGAELCLSFLVLECCSLECCSRRRPQLDTVRHLTGRDQTPQRYQQLARQCHDHCRLARAARTLGPRAIPLRQRTVFLEHQEAPRQLDQPTSYPRIAGLGQALLSAFQTALIGRSREPGIARQRSSISKIARQDLPHQHVRRLDTDTDHPGEQPHHRMRPGIRCTLEPLGTCLLYRADLLTDQCQPCHVAPKLLDDVCRQARALRGSQTCQTLWSLTQMWLESPDPETGKRTLHAVDDA